MPQPEGRRSVPCYHWAQWIFYFHSYFFSFKFNPFKDPCTKIFQVLFRLTVFRRIHPHSIGYQSDWGRPEANGEHLSITAWPFN